MRWLLAQKPQCQNIHFRKINVTEFSAESRLRTTLRQRNARLPLVRCVTFNFRSHVLEAKGERVMNGN